MQLFQHPKKEKINEKLLKGLSISYLFPIPFKPPKIREFVPGGNIPRVETKKRECWKFLDWRLNSENDSRVHGQPLGVVCQLLVDRVRESILCYQPPVKDLLGGNICGILYNGARLRKKCRIICAPIACGIPQKSVDKRTMWNSL